MLATIRNFLIWISINVLHIFALLYFSNENTQAWIRRGMNVLQVVNFALWLLISLGEGSSIENTDYILGYNCEVIDWMVMSGILLTINLFSVVMGYFKIAKLDWEIHQLKEETLANSRNIAAGEQ